MSYQRRVCPNRALKRDLGIASKIANRNQWEHSSDVPLIVATIPKIKKLFPECEELVGNDGYRTESSEIKFKVMCENEQRRMIMTNKDMDMIITLTAQIYRTTYGEFSEHSKPFRKLMDKSAVELQFFSSTQKMIKYNEDIAAELKKRLKALSLGVSYCKEKNVFTLYIKPHNQTDIKLQDIVPEQEDQLATYKFKSKNRRDPFRSRSISRSSSASSRSFEYTPRPISAKDSEKRSDTEDTSIIKITDEKPSKN